MLSLLRRLISFLILFVVVFIFVMFAVENKEKVVFSLYPVPFEIEIARYAIILISFALGYFIAIFHGIRMVRRQKSLTREARSRANSLENELKKLTPASEASTAKA